MPSWKVSMRDSMSNQTSHFGIMGGLYNRKVSGRSNTNRVTSRLTIPTGAAPGLKYMKMHNLLSKNPQGSGGVGKVVKSKPCNCGTLGKPLEKTLEDTLGKTELITEASPELITEASPAHTHLLGQPLDSDPSTNALAVNHAGAALGGGPYELASLMACTKISLDITNVAYNRSGTNYSLYPFGNKNSTQDGYMNFQNNNSSLPGLDATGSTNLGTTIKIAGNGDGTLLQQGSWKTATGDIYNNCGGSGCTIKITYPSKTTHDINIYNSGMKQIYYYAGSQNAWYGWHMWDGDLEKVNGDPPAAVKLGCGACIPGYSLVNNNTCIKNTCNCPNGVKATGKTCNVDQANICSSCSTGYYGPTCKPNACLCPNGTESKGVACLKNLASSCESCNDGYHKSSDGTSCVQNTCNCQHGAKATGKTCNVDQANICSSCSTGYYLDTSTCKPCTDTCSPGKTHFTGCGGVSSGTCVPNATCSDGSSFKDFGNDTQGYFCCTGGKEKFISTIPSCGGKDNKGNPGNNGMCIGLIPDGKTKADVDCGGTLKTCTWPITPADKI